MIFQEILQIQDKLIDFSPNSKIWVYYSDKDFSLNQAVIQEEIDSFTQSWKSHGDKVVAQGFVLGGNVIILVADTSQSEVSGCSTDSSVHFIQSLGTKYNLDFFNRNTVFYILNDRISTISMNEIATIQHDTFVFNPFFKDLNEWRNGFVQKLNESKYKRLL